MPGMEALMEERMHNPYGHKKSDGSGRRSMIREIGSFAYQSLNISPALVPMTQLLEDNEPITQHKLSLAIDKIFDYFYKHPLTQKSRKFTTYLREHNFIPNEETTENLIRYVVNQFVLRSPITVPRAVVDEFWLFFEELFSEPELKGLVELNLDITRLLLRTYEPLFVDVINLVKQSRARNQQVMNDLIERVQVIRGDLTIIRRQIKALRYIKLFFQTDPADFHTQAEIIANMVKDFGPFFIKIAQVAAANADFLPEEISKELMTFQEDVPPMTEEEVIKVFKDSVGKSPHECYFGFDANKPVKSGSIGSVYCAKKPVIEDSREVLIPVIVKIARHNLDREFLMGKTVLGIAIISSQYWAPHSKLTPFLKAMQEQVDEFTEGFQQELDFEEEARNQNKFVQRSQQSNLWRVPRVYAYSSRVLEMEYLDNVLNIQQAIKTFASAENPKFRQQVTERFLYTVLVQIFIYHECHGDLHPGNILVNPQGELYLIDWGNCIELEGKWKPVWRYIAGALLANVELLTEALIDISTAPEVNRKNRCEIEKVLSDTLYKKNITPLGKNVVFQLHKEGMDGLYRRGQLVMHLISNTQYLGIVVKGEYLHLSRSLFALIGAYFSLYEGASGTAITLDFLRGLIRFPINLAKDHFDVKRKHLKARFVKNIPFSSLFSSRVSKNND